MNQLSEAEKQNRRDTVVVVGGLLMVIVYLLRNPQFWTWVAKLLTGGL